MVLINDYQRLVWYTEALNTILRPAGYDARIECNPWMLGTYSSPIVICVRHPMSASPWRGRVWIMWPEFLTSNPKPHCIGLRFELDPADRKEAAKEFPNSYTYDGLHLVSLFDHEKTTHYIPASLDPIEVAQSIRTTFDHPFNCPGIIYARELEKGKTNDQLQN